MTSASKLKQGREAFKQQDWKDSYSLLSSADRKTPLEAEDLERLAKAAYLIGRESDSTESWARAHREFLNLQNIRKAANCAFWLGMMLFFQGEKAQGGGWIARAGRLIDDFKEECPEQGFLLIPEALQCLGKGDPDQAYNLFSRAAEIGKRLGNADLTTLGRLGSGQALVGQHKIKEGTTLLDEAMVAVVADEVSPIVAGIVYCAVIETCQKIYDLRRAQEWTTALTKWCDSQPDLIPYRGQCLVRRAEIKQLHGEWPDAMNEVQRACELYRTSSPLAGGEAFYRQAELHRLQGDFSKAEKTYRRASKLGRDPQPGLALMRLAQGKIDAAVAAIRSTKKERKDPITRSRILPAYIEIMLAAGDVEEATSTSDELADIASELEAPFLKGVADRALGSVLLANGEPLLALGKLRHACSVMEHIGASYELARTKVFIGHACRELGDKDTSVMELDIARWIFEQLGALPDLAKVDSIIDDASVDNNSKLTPRELQVLRFLATGKTNKKIAKELFISERTVDRHVSNIFGKIDVSSRSAATAYAYEHNLV